MQTWITRLNRFLLIALAAVPFLPIGTFYPRFHMCLNGRAIIGIVKGERHLVVISIVVFGLFLIPLTYHKRADWLNYGLVGTLFSVSSAAGVEISPVHSSRSS